MQTHRRTIACKAALLALGFITLTGCATGYPGAEHPTDQQQQWSYQGSTVTFLPAEGSEPVAGASAGTVVDAGWTRWGDNTRVTVLDRYFAASGRVCLRADITGSKRSETVNLCEYREGLWGATRVLAESNGVTP